ncbi:transposase [Bacilli bacterium]|uniref:zinc ribbon domain-containing protein n=2 Tax=Oceanobacillus caeni TaxID=405946 RepID=UPI000A07C4CC|nr:transposase [Oceanobacillus caeni]PZD86121.1 hypothetical protein DEJ64_08170 [Bacilli bacterium]PZD89418.1 hypothetical protein DEJ60_04915 [Bacilli bacterium]PZD90558.1 hypothetical protein DEJ66_09595 [Bacilli bacterium]RCO06137.1 transposase [Bacilli bacterium]
MHSWSFYQLKQFIKEKASKYNIPVVDINPYQTGQICGCCGHAERKNRNGIKFHCVKCNYTCHADLNAANNIARSTSLAG